MSASRVCVDAGVVLRLVLGTGNELELSSLWENWARRSLVVVAPTLLLYEVTNVLHRYRHAGLISREAALAALDAALGLPVALEGGAALHRRAAELAHELGLAAAYDAHYLALAETLACELWTTDAKLTRRVSAILRWVRLVAPDPGS
jgi:predicted nucleic acid-binding protein